MVSLSIDAGTEAPRSEVTHLRIHSQENKSKMQVGGGLPTPQPELTPPPDQEAPGSAVHVSAASPRVWLPGAQGGRLRLWTDQSPAGLNPRQATWSLQGLPEKMGSSSPLRHLPTTAVSPRGTLVPPWTTRILLLSGSQKSLPPRGELDLFPPWAFWRNQGPLSRAIRKDPSPPRSQPAPRWARAASRSPNRQ